jgi:site-specific DNA recombinase
MIKAAIYARVSSEKQVQSNTIESQISSLEKQIVTDGYILLKELKFVDNGYSGSNIIRPALERLRDAAAKGELDKIYIHSPDRLSRKYAHQILLVEEFQKNYFFKSSIW